jgi:lipopolysaccharide export system protein LptA
MSPHRAARLLAGLGLGAAAAIAAAQDRDPAVDSLRPTGPVTVTADRAEWEQNGAMVYSGKVALSSDTLKLKGDRLELRQHPGGQFEAQVTGNPARLDHPGLKDRRGEPGPPVSAEARTLSYDSRSGVVDISGKAKLLRGEDEVHGENIRYDVIARRIRAVGGEGGQVRIVIQPPPKEGGAGGAGGGGSSRGTVPAAPVAPLAPKPALADEVDDPAAAAEPAP